MPTQTPSVKRVGRRRPTSGGLEKAAGFLELIVSLRGNRPFVPRGVRRFETFEEAQAWSIRMMARPSNPVRPPSATS